MCLGYEGVLVEAIGSGVVRTGVLRVGDRDYEIGLACVPDASVGDWLIAHSGQALRRATGDGLGFLANRQSPSHS